MSLLDALFPPSCCVCARPCDRNAGFCATCLLTFEPASPIDLVAPLDAIVSPWLYGGQLAVAIERLKYHRHVPSATGIAQTLRAPLAAALAHWQPDYLVAVPMPLGRALWRGVVHAALLLDKAAPASAYALIKPRLLRRTRASTPQARLSRTRRLSNLADAFRATRSLTGVSVVLFDDVMTTGATLAACAKACKAAGARAVFGFVAAHNA